MEALKSKLTRTFTVEQTKKKTLQTDLIEQVLDQCSLTPADRTKLGKLLAITANTAKWTESELHALLKKKTDPSIRNYTAFVWWSAKVTGKKNQS